MKRFAIVTGICASFLLGAALTVVAQDEHKDENSARPEHQEPRQDQAKPDEHPNGERPKQADEDRKNNEARPAENRQSGDRKEVAPQNEAHPQNAQSGDRHDRPEGREHGRHIADNDFRAHFGREHRFAPGRVQVVNGRSQFIYSGYTFVLVDTWPAGWGYDSDDCYVDYIDGDYYLFNVRYPGVRILLLIL